MSVNMDDWCEVNVESRHAGFGHGGFLYIKECSMKRVLMVLVAGVLFFCLVCAGCIFSPGPAPFAENPGEAVDPALVRGVLPNGFQYVLLENHTPADRVSMHLNVFAGSVHETDEEQGLAHYLEHMVFNGSEHFKPGELIEFFQSIGMGFGADANASTSYFRTTYDLDLPRAEEKLFKDALLVFKDYARGALILEEEVDRERGIILAEKRVRDSVSYQIFKKKLLFELPGSLLNRRHPIGLQKIIEGADRALLKGFYDTWYRPDNMAFVAVGDFDAKLLETLLINTFSDLSPSPDRVKNFDSFPDISWDSSQNTINTFYHHDPEAQVTTISMERIRFVPFEKQSIEDLKKELLADVGHAILTRRLVREIRNQTTRFSSGSTFTGQFLHNISLASIEGEYTDAEHWEKGVRELEYLLRQALEYGFTKGEVEREKADLIATLTSDAKQAATRKSNSLARQLLFAMNNKKLFLSPQQRMEILVPFVKSLSLEDVNEAFQKAWGGEPPLICVTGKAVIEKDGTKTPEKQIQDVYEKASQSPVKPFVEATAKQFPYLPIPGQENTGRLARIVAQKKDVNGLGITTVDFDNGVRLNIKHTDFQDNQMGFSLVFGDGLNAQPASKQGLGLLGEGVINESGFGAMNVQELEQALAGHNLSAHFSVDDNHFSYGGTGDAKELELVFQLIYTFLNDPGFTDQAVNLVKSRYEQDFNTQEHTIRGSYLIKGLPFLTGGDSRFGMPDPKNVNAFDLSDVKNWLEPYIRNAPVELSIVGDVDPEKVLKYAKTYLGGLENRTKILDVKNRPVHFPRGKSLELPLETRMEKAMVRLCFPTDDYWDIKRTRRLSVLADVFSDRLRKSIREELGIAYSPYAYHYGSKAVKGYGVFQAVAMVAPKDKDRVMAVIEDIAEDLHENGVTEKEFKLLIKSVLEHVKVKLETNEYWLNSVMKNSSRFPCQLEWPVSIMEDFQKISPRELSRLAGEYLKPASRAKIIISQKN